VFLAGLITHPGNPLSAMVQCADSISISMKDMQNLIDDQILVSSPELRDKLQDAISASVDSIETIQACATHQKRIVDDILTLSKLDSKLLAISPTAVQPAALLRDTYKMFKEEASKANLDLKVHYDTSFLELGLDFVFMDPSRVLQILISEHRHFSSS
jgi:signal transduction histidine kinase